VEPYSQAIGRFVRGLSIDDVPQAVVDKAKLVLLDTIGVALASSTMQFGAMVTRVAQAFGGRRTGHAHSWPRRPRGVY
jgi:2-methylcitrate dehydratase PrpD